MAWWEWTILGVSIMAVCGLLYVVIAALSLAGKSGGGN